MEVFVSYYKEWDDVGAEYGPVRMNEADALDDIPSNIKRYGVSFGTIRTTIDQVTAYSIFCLFEQEKSGDDDSIVVDR